MHRAAALEALLDLEHLVARREGLAASRDAVGFGRLVRAISSTSRNPPS